jgi:CBS domain-containing protein
MKTFIVKELMVPLAEYATVSADATLSQAMVALDKAQKEFNHNRYRHRAILVLNKDNQVVGKLSQHDVIKSLEPKYKKIQSLKSLDRFGISLELSDAMMEHYSLWDKFIDSLCLAAGEELVKEIMHTPTEGEYIEEDASIHRLVVGHHHSLLVTQGNDIVGILRLTDVFSLISQKLLEMQC